MSLYAPFAFQNKQDQEEPFRFLLDEVPTANAAYSLRKLSSTYTGDAITVRRSSDSTELDFGFDATGNLDTAAILSFVGAGNGLVRRIYDQSQNGVQQRNLTPVNGTTTTWPFIVKSGVLQVNPETSRPALRFENAQAGMGDSFPTNATSTQNATLSTVQNPDPGNTNWIPFMNMGIANSNFNYQLIRLNPNFGPGGNTGVAGMYRGNTTNRMCVDGVYLSGTEVQTCTQDGVVFPTAEAKLWRNGTQVTITNDNEDSAECSNGYIGMGADPFGQRFTFGYHHEAVCWFSTKTPAQVDTINEIANGYYGIY